MGDPRENAAPGETLEQYGDRIAAKVRKQMMDRLDDDVIGYLGTSHIVFGKACAMEAVTTAMDEMAKGIATAKESRPITNLAATLHRMERFLEDARTAVDDFANAAAAIRNTDFTKGERG